jgi:peptidoglycan/LPS O-acetylase OafA/YrhL
LNLLVGALAAPMISSAVDVQFKVRSSAMIAIRNLRISLLSETNLDQKFYHCILISLFRGVAALEVAASHLRAQTLPSLRSLPDPNIWYQALSFFTGFAHQAVVVFFLVSGWLVGGSLLNKLNSSNAMLTYCVDRITRLWIVLIPVFLVTMLFGMVTGNVDPGKFDHSLNNEYSTVAFLGSLFGLQDIVVPCFGGNFSLWSLSYEISYYVLFPLALMSFVARKTTERIVSAIAALVLASHLNVAILLYFSVWTLGAAFSRIKIDLDKFSRTLLLAIFVVVAVYFRLRGENYILTEKSFLQDLLYSFIFLLLLSSQQWKADVNSRKVRVFKTVGEFLSKFSFTLYVIHVPLLGLFRYVNKRFFGIEALSPDEPIHYAIYFSMLAGIVLFSYLFYLLFEAQTYKVRGHMKRMILNWSFRFSRSTSPSEAKPEMNRP